MWCQIGMKTLCVVRILRKNFVLFTVVGSALCGENLKKVRRVVRLEGKCFVLSEQ